MKTYGPTICILLPTYNGSKYLPILLESLVRQTVNFFTVLTLDDSSHDDSIKIVDSYRNKLQIVRIKHGCGNQGAIRSFERLLAESDSDFVFFCDQDDYWHPQKIERCLKEMQYALNNNNEIPTMVFCDLEIMDFEGLKRYPSFLEYWGVNLNTIDDPYYLVQKSPAPGCSMMINRALAEISLPFGTNTIMHDWWLSLIACICGKMIYIPEKLIRYRIHDSNTMGIIREKGPLPNLFDIFTRFPTLLLQQKKMIIQAKEAYNRTGHSFSEIRYWKKLIKRRYLYPILLHLGYHPSEHSWRV